MSGRCARIRTARAAAVIVCLLVSGGCTSIPVTGADYGDISGPLELTQTPFYPQDAYQCGPAALMTVLTASGVDTTLDALIKQVYLPARQGSLQPELKAATRGSGLVPYEVEPTLPALVAELKAGRPVLVLQNLGVNWIPRWHYAVVVGVDPARHLITLRSGTDPLRVTPTALFLRTWQRSGNWAIVALPPEQLPALLNRNLYLSAVTALEETGHTSTARQAWQAGLQHWENDDMLLFGLANAEFSLANYVTAAQLYTAILDADEGAHITRNNLALTLAAQGLTAEAIQQIDLAIELAAGTNLEPALQETRKEILTGSEDESAGKKRPAQGGPFSL